MARGVLFYMAVCVYHRGRGRQGGKTMFGAPYDFRLPVNVLMNSDVLGINKVRALVSGLRWVALTCGWQTYNQALVELIEKAYHVNDLPVHIITHSMGGPTALYFLNHQARVSFRARNAFSFVFSYTRCSRKSGAPSLSSRSSQSRGPGPVAPKRYARTCFALCPLSLIAALCSSRP